MLCLFSTPLLRCAHGMVFGDLLAPALSCWLLSPSACLCRSRRYVAAARGLGCSCCWGRSGGQLPLRRLRGRFGGLFVSYGGRRWLQCSLGQDSRCMSILGSWQGQGGGAVTDQPAVWFTSRLLPGL